MPDPKSARGERVTGTGLYTATTFEQPFVTPIYALDGGLDLIHAVDAVPVGKFTRSTNIFYTLGEPRAVTGRPGQTTIATGGSTIHSVLRLNNSLAGGFTRVWGVDTHVAIGATGALNLIDSGYSGDPLTIVSGRPPLSNAPWAFIADRSKMAKVRNDGLVTPIGLLRRFAAMTASALVLSDKGIYESLLTPPGFAWVPNSGFYDFQPGQNQPTPSPMPSAPTGAVFPLPTVALGFDLFATNTPFFVYWSAPITLNLAVGVDGAQNLSGQTTPAIDPPPAPGSPVPITDEALMYTYFLTLSAPGEHLTKVRLYVVVSQNFSTAVLPGAANPTNANSDFYMKAFRAGDFAPMLAALATQANQSEVAQVNLLRQQALAQSGTAQGFGSGAVRADNTFLAAFDPADAQSLEASTSAAETVPFGVVGNPLHRGDWQRYGSTTGRDWSTVTGLVLYVHAVYTGLIPAEFPVTVTMDQWALKGQGGSDSSDAAAASYDWRYTHYDPRTGAESNPCPIMATTAFLDSLTQVFTLTPTASGLGGVIQRFYRRGGTLTSDWFFLGANKADGGVFIDLLPDADLVDAGTVAINHYQPVPSVDGSGNTLLAQPVPVLIGPINGMLLALGDPNQPGTVYASLPDAPDHWDPTVTTEVCPPSEQLMNGCCYGSQAYVFSREALYAVYTNLGGAVGLTSLPTQCKRGLAGRWAMALGYGLIWFTARDGVYSTNGGGQTLISQEIQSLFLGQTVNGYAPIDFTQEAALRMGCFTQEVWLLYQDTNGARNVQVHQILTGKWRHYSFANALAMAQEDQGGGEAATFLLGGASSGKAYTHTGTSDDGAAISAAFRTASWDWGRPREEKLFGDQIMDVNPNGVVVTWQNFINAEVVVNPAQPLPVASLRSAPAPSSTASARVTPEGTQPRHRCELVDRETYRPSATSSGRRSPRRRISPSTASPTGMTSTTPTRSTCSG